MKAVLFFVLGAVSLSYVAPVSSQAVPDRLATLSRAYLDDRSTNNETQLREYAGQAGGESAALANFVLGYVQWQNHHFSDAAQYLQHARASESALSDYADFDLVSSLQNLGDNAGALPILDGFDTRHPGSVLVGRALMAQATALDATGAAGPAIAFITSHPDALAHPAADLLLAKAYAGEGKSAEAAAAYARIYYNYPASFEAEEAAKHKATFPKASGEMLARRAALLAAAAATRPALQRTRLYEEAEADYKLAASAATGADHEVDRVAAAALIYKIGHYPQARAALAELALSSPEADAERLYWLSQCDYHLKREAERAADLVRLRDKYPKSQWLEEALYSFGNDALVHGSITAAAPFYDELARRFPDGKYASQSHWRAAWSRYRAGDYEGARLAMDEQIRLYPATPLTVAAIYWSGRIRETNEKSGAQAYYKKAVEGFPSNFYGILARGRLTENVSHLGAPFVAPTAPADSAVPRRQFAAMRALGLVDLAAQEMRAMTQLKGREKDKPYWNLEIAGLEHERGHYFASLESAVRGVANYTQLDPASIPADVWAMLYPLPWWQEIQQEAAAENLDPYLIAGLIRQESAWNDHALSRTNAYGLMQIEPRTGRELARKLAVANYSTNSLYQPRINIRMGVYYFKRLIEDNGGRLEDALAAYNAGLSRVNNWRRPGFQDVDEFVESIPFSETREYVQIVLRNAEIYRRLYATNKPAAAAGQ